MSLLKNVSKGKIKQPDLILIYGVDGVGKSTFASQAPNPIFLGPERGTNQLDVARFNDIDSFKSVNLAIDELAKETHDYETLVIDSLDWMEPLVWASVCQSAGVSNIELAYGGYGKGYHHANSLWSDLVSKLSFLRDHKKMNIILIAHSQIKAFNDPQNNATYDRFQMKLNEKTSALFREYVDCVLFANFVVHTTPDGKKKSKAYGEDDRRIYTSRRPAFDAKTRFSLPFQLPLDFIAFQEAKGKSYENQTDDIINDIETLIVELNNEEKEKMIRSRVELAGKNPEKLLLILNRLRTFLSQ